MNIKRETEDTEEFKLLKTRVITGFILFALLLIILFFGPVVFGISVFIFALVGIYEFYNAVSNVGYKPVRIVGYLSCLTILMVTFNNGALDNQFAGHYINLFKSISYFSAGLFVIFFILFLFIVFLHEKYNVNDIALTVFGIFYVMFLFSFLVLTRNLNNGIYYIWFVFIGAWGTDISAYFTGKLIGKRKILPAISPKKTVEGTIGGIVGCSILTAGYSILLVRMGIISWDVSVVSFILLGLINGIISQVGDWGASAIKRHSNIKDYGTIFPGHGGVLDRFDSILFVAPIVYFFFYFFKIM
jgi:phosphatidate cytidylyltransferase